MFVWKVGFKLFVLIFQFGIWDQKFQNYFEKRFSALQNKKLKCQCVDNFF